MTFVATYLAPHPDSRRARVVGVEVVDAPHASEGYRIAHRRRPVGATHLFLSELLLQREVRPKVSRIGARAKRDAWQLARGTIGV